VAEAPEAPSGRAVEPASITQRILIEDRLDSADEPRPRPVEKPAAKS
jgi:hypothetical protein